MFRGIWGQAPSVRSDSGRRVGQRFETLATSLQKATSTEREAQLKEIEARNPGLANRLRRFLEQSADVPQKTLGRLGKVPADDKETLAGWPQPDPAKWRETIDPAKWQEAFNQQLPGLFPATPAAGLMGQERHAIIFEPEPVPVMGTTAPPPGKVVAYGGQETPVVAAAVPIVVGATSWQGRPLAAVLGAYRGIITDE